MCYDKKDFKLKLIRSDIEGHFILIKGTVNQEVTTVLNTYTPNSGEPKLIK